MMDVAHCSFFPSSGQVRVIISLMQTLPVVPKCQPRHHCLLEDIIGDNVRALTIRLQAAHCLVEWIINRHIYTVLTWCYRRP